MKKIYFLCTGNSCRSQIAEGYARKYLSPSMFEIRSAGIETHGLNPRAFFFKQKTAYEIPLRLVGSEMCIRRQTQFFSQSLFSLDLIRTSELDENFLGLVTIWYSFNILVCFF